MKFIYNETLTKDVVQKYYKTYEDIDGVLEIKCGVRKVPLGRSLVGHEFPYVSFRLKGAMDIDGEMQPVELVVSEDEIRNAFTVMTEAWGMRVKCISTDYDENGLIV